jgi:hypothetical protein
MFGLVELPVSAFMFENKSLAILVLVAGNSWQCRRGMLRRPPAEFDFKSKIHNCAP